MNGVGRVCSSSQQERIRNFETFRWEKDEYWCHKKIALWWPIWLGWRLCNSNFYFQIRCQIHRLAYNGFVNTKKILINHLLFLLNDFETRSIYLSYRLKHSFLCLKKDQHERGWSNILFFSSKVHYFFPKR